MSPEQAGDLAGLTPASDIYSLGAVAYYLLTGKVPFDGRSAMQVLAAHIYEPPVPLANHGVTVPAIVEAVVFRCLEKRPADRFASAAELAAALSGAT